MQFYEPNIADIPDWHWAWNLYKLLQCWLSHIFTKKLHNQMTLELVRLKMSSDIQFLKKLGVANESKNVVAAKEPASPENEKN